MLLVACTSKRSYLNPISSEPEFNRIVVALDYVHFVDGLNELMDYDSEKNQVQIESLKLQITNVLKEKYYDVEWALVTSGVGLHPDMAFTHVRDGQRHNEILYPPFYIQSSYPFPIQDQLMASFMDAQRIALTPATKDNQNYLQRVHLKSINFQSLMTPATDSVGVLHIRVLVPQVSFLKKLGSGVVSVGISSGSVSGGHVGIGLPLTAGNQPLSTAVLFDNKNGRLLWKNQRNGDISRLQDDGIRYFFKALPVKP